jgi:hypothetical protein
MRRRPERSRRENSSCRAGIARLHLLVIPAKVGTHLAFDFAVTSQKSKWIPAFAGMTMFLSFRTKRKNPFFQFENCDLTRCDTIAR